MCMHWIACLIIPFLRSNRKGRKYHISLDCHKAMLVLLDAYWNTTTDNVFISENYMSQSSDVRTVSCDWLFEYFTHQWNSLVVELLFRNYFFLNNVFFLICIKSIFPNNAILIFFLKLMFFTCRYVKEKEKEYPI